MLTVNGVPTRAVRHMTKAHAQEFMMGKWEDENGVPSNKNLPVQTMAHVRDLVDAGISAGNISEMIVQGYCEERKVVRELAEKFNFPMAYLSDLEEFDTIVELRSAILDYVK